MNLYLWVGPKRESGMRGTFSRRTWQSDPALYAPARYRKACVYDAFIPEPISGFDPSLSGAIAGVVSDAEKAISDLNRIAGRELDPLARLLLRTESIASSRVEGMQVDARSLARAEANQDTGRRIGSDAAEILANVDAMQLAIERASSTDAIRVADIVAIHNVLMANAPNRATAGRVRDTQNWIGGNNYNPCGADFVPPPFEEVDRLLRDLAAFCNEDALPPLVQAAVAHAQFETVHPFEDGNGRTGRALIQVVLRRRKLALAFVPPVSVILAREKDRYINGLTLFREDHMDEWLEILRGRGLSSRGPCSALHEPSGRVAGTVAYATSEGLESTGRCRCLGHHRRSPCTPRGDGACSGCGDQANEARRHERCRRARAGGCARAARRVDAQSRVGGRWPVGSHRRS